MCWPLRACVREFKTRRKKTSYERTCPSKKHGIFGKDNDGAIIPNKKLKKKEEEEELEQEAVQNLIMSRC